MRTKALFLGLCLAALVPTGAIARDSRMLDFVGGLACPGIQEVRDIGYWTSVIPRDSSALSALILPFIGDRGCYMVGSLISAFHFKETIQGLFGRVDILKFHDSDGDMYIAVPTRETRV